MINKSFTEVLPCKCDAEECDYKQQWEEAGSPSRIPEQVAFGKQYMPLVSEWLKSKYCNRKGEQAQLID